MSYVETEAAQCDEQLLTYIELATAVDCEQKDSQALFTMCQ